MKNLTTALLTLAFASWSQAITIRMPGPIVGDTATITQDRFEANTPGAIANPDFQYSALDFSGVGWDSVNPNRSVTLISDRHFIASKHYNIGSSVSFLTASGVTSYTVSSQTFINNPAGGPGDPSGVSDLRIGTLTSPIDLGSAGINFYPILDPALSPVGQDVIVYGQNGRIGESKITQQGFITESGIDGYVNSSLYEIATGGANDAYVTSGDSGGPTFLINNSGQLVLTGIHWAVGNNGDNDAVPPVLATEIYNIDTDVRKYIAQADAQVSGLTITTAVPEPNSSLLMCSVVLGFAVLRKRK